MVTGIGVVLPNCDDRDTLWRHLRDGASQLAFEPEPGRPEELCPIGRIRGFEPDRYLDEIPRRFYDRYPRELQIYLAALLLARNDAALDLHAVRPERTGLFDGSSRAAFAFWHESIAQEHDVPLSELYTRRELLTGLPGQTVGVAASLLKIRGPAYCFSGTCSSGGMAIGHAFREVRSGELDVAFATGHETALLPPLYAMYRDAHLLSRERTDARRAVRPYVDYSTNAFGEGAITLVLESREHAEGRGAAVLAVVSGYKYGNNGYHPTTVDIAGVRPAEVISQLLSDTDTAREEIGFVVGHGNGVHISDLSEENCMRQVFGARSAQVPLLSTKPIYGHTLGASSSLNAAAAVLMLHHDYIIPTINIDEARVKRAANHQANLGVARRSAAGLALSYGMGGHNTALLLRRASPPPRDEAASVAAGSQET